MRILITGGGGFLGQRLARRLARDGAIAGKKIDSLTLLDLIKPLRPAGAGFPVCCLASDLTAPASLDTALAEPVDLLFHLACLASGGAEADFDAGMRVNLDASRALFEAVRQAGHRPRLVFTSSIAVFGAPFPALIPDDFHLTPLNSYGMQKAVGELLLADFSRREFFDGIAIRLPTIVVRPGKPNTAASSFFSGIIREPLHGHAAICPVPTAVRHWFASPDKAVDYLLHAATLDSAALGGRRALTLPGLSLTVAEMIEALERVAGPKATALISHQPNRQIADIIANWPQNFLPRRALDLGFVPDADFDGIIRAFQSDMRD